MGEGFMKNTKITILLLCLVLLLPQGVLGAGGRPPVASNRNVVIVLNGKKQDIPKDLGVPYLDKKTQRTMIPIRYIGEALGLEVAYIPENKEGYHAFLLGNDEFAVGMPIGAPFAVYVRGAEEKVIDLDGGAYIYNGRSYAPLRFISEVMGYKVTWTRDEKKNTDQVTIQAGAGERKTKAVSL